MKKMWVLSVALLVGIAVGSFTLGPVISQVVNSLVMVPSATGSAPYFGASGSDTNIGVQLRPKGTGAFQLKGDTAGVHLEAQNATPPTLSACGSSSGSSSAVETGSNDMFGRFTAGTSATSCTLTFATDWSQVPFCVITGSNVGGTSITTIASVPRLASSFTTSFIATLFRAGDTLTYHCGGRFS